jgi:hypothetical protein
MTLAFLTLVLTQAGLTAPPLAPPAAPSASELTEPPEVKLFAQFVERHLLAINASGSGIEVRQRERVLRLQDDDFETAFTLVPEALADAKVAHADYLTSSRLQVIGLSATGGALLAVVLSTVLRSVLVPLLVIGLVGSVVGLVLTLIALPFSISAQTKFFSAVATYNRGLLELRPGATPPVPGGVTLPLPQ